MPYNNKDYKESNVKYLNKDFLEIKSSLIQYAKSYFPETYKDFNETSPGMMLLEMNAYVGDVLSFYIDRQYQEMLLPLAEERRNVMNMAKMFGYKVKPVTPAFVDLTVESEVKADRNDRSKVDYTNAGAYSSGIQVQSTVDSDVVFETLDVVDFSITGSNDTAIVKTRDSNNLIDTYLLNRTVRAVSGKTKELSFSIGAPQKFRKITLPDTNVVDIISCIDSNGNKWYEVDYLAQDKVPLPKHYTNDHNRTSAYYNQDGSSILSDVPVPYSLEYIKTQKRFTRETNLDNTTSLVFGNGILKNGTTLDDNFIGLEQVGIVIPGQSQDLTSALDPLQGDEYSTLGETPAQTTLTIQYRVGGGFVANTDVGSISDKVNATITLENSPVTIGGNVPSISNISNKVPSRGGRNDETVDEIKENTKSFFSTQNRCVTKEDYEARVLNMSSKFGSVAKVYVERNDINEAASNTYSNATYVQNYIASLNTILANISSALSVNSADSTAAVAAVSDLLGTYEAGTTPSLAQITQAVELGTINIYILSYNSTKSLVGNPHTSITQTNDDVPLIIKDNIKKYLENYKILTDEINILDGYVVNFGVFFDVIAHNNSNKSDVKMACIQKIKEYFKIENMQFRQPIFISQLEYELMDLEGVRAVNYVNLTQHEDPDSLFSFENSTYKYSFSQTEDNTIDIHTEGYGYKYDFNYATEGGLVIPSVTPSVFELKNPNQNIKGVVR
tara:strand:- start:999 stop:3185 length:2187 start_codon:yes stop_codon:yes gene_type:complete